MSAFIVIGLLALVAGVVMVVTAVRGPVGERSKSAAVLLIAGAMVAAFGLLIAGFAIAWQNAGPAGALQ